jgi:hypothetical protein
MQYSMQATMAVQQVRHAAHCLVLPSAAMLCVAHETDGAEGAAVRGPL